MRHGVRPNLALTVVVLGCAHCSYTPAQLLLLPSAPLGLMIQMTYTLQMPQSNVAPIEKLSVNSVVSSPVSQKLLSSKVNDYCFQVLFDQSSPANKARLLSVSAPHATSWLSVIPSTSLALHLDPIEFRVAVKWWLGLDTSQGSQCAFCPAHNLDPLGHHALTCKYGGDVITHHNALRAL